MTTSMVSCFNLALLDGQNQSTFLSKGEEKIDKIKIEKSSTHLQQQEHEATWKSD